MRRPIRQRISHRFIAAAVALTLFGPGGAWAAGGADADPDPPDTTGDDERLHVYDEVEVKGRGDTMLGIAESAAEGSTGSEDLERRPIQRAGELVETVPGVIATQHSGGGKANQYFVRGFNLDHGTDFSVTVAGMPVNMPSHGHGQGWIDLNFLIPEMIDRVRYHKGLSAAEKGDFSAAAAIDIDLKRSLSEGLFALTGGSDSYGRLLAADSFHAAGGHVTAALELYHDDGPWQRGDDYDRFNALVHYVRGSFVRGHSITAMAYDGSWLSTDQVPRRAVESGLIDRFGLIDEGPRGSAARYSLSGELHRGSDSSLTRLGAYLLYSDLDLISNFTYFLDDPVNGDQFKQVDRRWVWGADLSHEWLGSWNEKSLEIATGLQLRFDDVDTGLLRTRDRERFATTREDQIRLWTGGPYAEASVRWHEKLRTTFGLRADFYDTDVASDLAVNSGSANDFLLSPKLAVVLGPWKHTEVYLNFGYGFHSNDARGATLSVDPVTGESAERVPPLVRATGAEAGVRTSLAPGLQSTLSLFRLELDSELVFVGDGGTTEAGRPSRRTGVEWTNHYRPTSWLAVDLDVALSHAEFTDDDPVGDHIVGALESVVAAGLSVESLGPWFGSLRLRYFSGYPLVEDDSVRAGATLLVNGRIGYNVSDRLALALEGFNLLDREDSDIEYFYASRLPGEAAEGVEDVHFSPVEGRSARLTLSTKF